MSPQKLLIKWREEKGVSLRAAATLFGAARSTICKIELGQRWPDLNQAFAIEDQTGIPARAWLRKKKGKVS